MRISMHRKMSHPNHIVPLSLGMSFYEFFCKHIGCFPYNLQILYKSRKFYRPFIQYRDFFQRKI